MLEALRLVEGLLVLSQLCFGYFFIWQFMNFQLTSNVYGKFQYVVGGFKLNP